MRINEHEVYTPKEARLLLKVSPSTITRMIKAGLIRTAKVGKQYRIMGKELLRVISPVLEDKMGRAYNKVRQWVHEDDVDGPKSIQKKISRGGDSGKNRSESAS